MVDEPVPATAAARSRSRRRQKGPKPWFVLKLSVALAAGIISYSSYVYIGRLCIPMIKRERNSLGSRRLGSESRCLSSLLTSPVLSSFDLNLRWRPLF
jgi:palmitoyltransferase